MGNDVKIDDVIKTLEQRRTYLLEQLKRIETAIKAIKGDLSREGDNIVSQPETGFKRRSKPLRRISWTHEIREVLQTKRDSFTIEDLQQILYEKGFESAKSSGRNSINTALSRMVDNEEIERIGVGKYKVKDTASHTVHASHTREDVESEEDTSS